MKSLLLLTITLLLTLALSAPAKDGKYKSKHKMHSELLADISAYWTADQRADLNFPLHDQVGYAHLTPRNLSFTEDGISEGAVVFTGNEGFASFVPNPTPTDSASLAAKAAVRMGAGQSYSILAWIKFESLTGTAITGGAKFIVSKLNAAPGGPIEYGIVWSANTELLQFRHGSGGANADVVEAVTHGPMTVNQWYHVFAWFDAETQRIGISINLGQSDWIDTTELGGVGSPEPTFTLGLSSDGAGGDFRGQVDELAIFKRVAYDAALFHYNGGKGTSWKEFWKHDNPPECKAITCCN